MCRPWRAEQSERQEAVDRRRCSRLLSSGSQVRVLPGHRQEAASGLGEDVEEARHVLKDRLQSIRTSVAKGVGAEVDAGRLLGWRLPGALGEPHGQALWTHATFLLEAEDDVGLDALDAVAEKVTWSGDRGPRYGELEPVALRISLDSAVAYRKAYGHIAACVARMVGVQTAVWGAAVDLDRRLLSVGAQPRAESLRGLGAPVGADAHGLRACPPSTRRA